MRLARLHGLFPENNSFWRSRSARGRAISLFQLRILTRQRERNTVQMHSARQAAGVHRQIRYTGVMMPSHNRPMGTGATLFKWCGLGAGLLLVLAGMLTFWLPIPIGLPLILLGMPLVLRNSPVASRMMLSIAANRPQLRRLVRRLADPGMAANAARSPAVAPPEHAATGASADRSAPRGSPSSVRTPRPPAADRDGPQRPPG